MSLPTLTAKIWRHICNHNDQISIIMKAYLIKYRSTVDWMHLIDERPWGLNLIRRKHWTRVKKRKTQVCGIRIKHVIFEIFNSVFMTLNKINAAIIVHFVRVQKNYGKRLIRTSLTVSWNRHFFMRDERFHYKISLYT